MDDRRGKERRPGMEEGRREKEEMINEGISRDGVEGREGEIEEGNRNGRREEGKRV